MTDLAEKLRLSDRFAEMCRPVSAQYGKGEIDRHTAVDQMEEKRTFLDIDPNVASVIINSQLNGADKERELRAKANGKAGHTPAPEYQVQPRSGLALLDKSIPPLKWVLPGYIPEGCTLLASRPKLGKSHLIVGLSHAITTGGKFFDRDCHQRKVLYLAIEEGERNLQGRMFRTAPRDMWQQGFDYDFRLANLDRGGIQDLARVLDTYHYGVVFVDTMAAVKGRPQKGETDYDHDYRTVAAFRQLAGNTGTSIILIHHTRKAKDNLDVLDLTLGTRGLQGAADTLIVLTQTEHGIRWYAVGREAEGVDVALDADLQTNSWTVLGDYEADPDIANTTQKILTALSVSKYPLNTKQVAEASGIPVERIGRQLRRLAKYGKIRKTDRGLYTYA